MFKKIKSIKVTIGNKNVLPKNEKKINNKIKKVNKFLIEMRDSKFSYVRFERSF